MDPKDPVDPRDNRVSVEIVESQDSLVSLVHQGQEEKLDLVGSLVLMDHREQLVSFST